MNACRFTVICEFRGGTYVVQVAAEDVREAVRAWAGYLAREKPISRVSGYLAKSIAADLAEFPPAALEGMSGVWCVTALCGGDLMLATIVESADRN